MQFDNMFTNGVYMISANLVIYVYKIDESPCIKISCVVLSARSVPLLTSSGYTILLLVSSSHSDPHSDRYYNRYPLVMRPYHCLKIHIFEYFIDDVYQIFFWYIMNNMHYIFHQLFSIL